MPALIELVEYGGRTYRRYPASKRRSHRVYFQCHDAWKKPVRYLHRDIWTDLHGPIPGGHDVHHKDDDPLNNEPSNLECLPRRRHGEEHLESNREKRRAWLETPSGKEHSRRNGERLRRMQLDPSLHATRAQNMRKVWESVPVREFVCEECGGVGSTRCARRVRYCSNPCEQRARYWRKRPGPRPSSPSPQAP